jgi:hypothetical protein
MTLNSTDILKIQSAIDRYKKRFPRKPSPSADDALASQAAGSLSPPIPRHRAPPTGQQAPISQPDANFGAEQAPLPNRHRLGAEPNRWTLLVVSRCPFGKVAAAPLRSMWT